jgi:hypothetical protein
MKLVKRENDYCLYNESEETIAASWANVTGKKLSKQNCDEIFGVVDVEKLAEKEYPTFNLELNLTTSFNTLAQVPFIKGFNKAMELNKDKMFTLGDVATILVDLLNDISNWKYRGTSTDIINQILEKIQQPTEIEVEIEMENKEYILNQNGEGFEDQSYRTWEKVPKLDSNGNLILRKL